jgi:transcriptional regulator with XRE-family HTH domain
VAMNSLPSIDLDIASRLRSDPEFRQAYFLAESSAFIARQLNSLRKRRGLSQKQVADELKTGQPAISRVESADYRNWSFNTLRRLAGALDARLRVIIEPSEDVFSEYAGGNDQTSRSSSESNLTELQRIFDVPPSAPLKRFSSILDEDGTNNSALSSPPTKQTPRSSVLDATTASTNRQTNKERNELTGEMWN